MSSAPGYVRICAPALVVLWCYLSLCQAWLPPTRATAHQATWGKSPRRGSMSSMYTRRVPMCSVLDMRGVKDYSWKIAKTLMFPAAVPATNSYWLTRQVFLRALGLVYATAFLVALHQNRALLGNQGILPVRKYLNRVERAVHDEHDRWTKDGTQSWRAKWQSFLSLPTLLWLVDRNDTDKWMNRMAATGLALSLVMMLFGTVPAVGAFIMWILYQSINNVGQTWYSFGWESQLIETGFLAIFLCPLWSLNAFNPFNQVATAVVWLYRWLLFRIMLGAGLIKIRGGREWRELTAMDWFYETQPVPSPASYYMHQSPKPFHRFEVLMNHVVELVGPWLVLVPIRSLRLFGGLLQFIFQVVLIISGNLSFLNWLTALPAIWCMDDAFLMRILPSFLKPSAQTLAALRTSMTTAIGRTDMWWATFRATRNVALLALIGVLSVPVITNLFSDYQIMNRSFNQWHLVNTYGAFGTVTKERYEVIIQGADEYKGEGTEWKEYVFKVKPGPVDRRPPLITPYHYRLDWLAWFLPLGRRSSYPVWFISFLSKLLDNDKAVTALLDHNPYSDRPQGAGPKYIRAMLYRYKFTARGSEAAKRGQWWERKEAGTYFPMRSKADLKNFL